MFQEDQKILKLRPRDTDNNEKNIVGFHIISLILIDKNKVEKLQMPFRCHFFKMFVTSAFVFYGVFLMPAGYNDGSELKCN